MTSPVFCVENKQNTFSIWLSVRVLEAWGCLDQFNDSMLLQTMFPKGKIINPAYFIRSHLNHIEADNISIRNTYPQPHPQPPLASLAALPFTVIGQAIKIINRKVLMKYQLGHKRRPVLRL